MRGSDRHASPAVPHLLEYRTPLRTKLRYFPLFIQSWEFLRPVYQYLSEKYPQDRLMDMYSDFVAANRAFLEEILHLPYEQRPEALARRDLFPKAFENDEYYDIIRDYCRYKLAQTAAQSSGAEICEVYCFSPLDIREKARLQDYRRCIAIVRFKDGKTAVSISGLK